MADIFDIPAIWRQRLVPASFRGARFHCESNSRDCGRRIVQHEFPKKEYPYAEDMGRRSKTFDLRGYCIVFPHDTGDNLFQRDYRQPRDRLRRALDAEGPALLQLPTQAPEMVVCVRYRLTEEQRFGGYCVFDMSFQEAGLDPQRWAPMTLDTTTLLEGAAKQVRDQVLRAMKNPTQLPETPQQGVSV
jgi:prophage DNA circulation protein